VTHMMCTYALPLAYLVFTGSDQSCLQMFTPYLACQLPLYATVGRLAIFMLPPCMSTAIKPIGHQAFCFEPQARLDHTKLVDSYLVIASLVIPSLVIARLVIASWCAIDSLAHPLVTHCFANGTRYMAWMLTAPTPPVLVAHQGPCPGRLSLRGMTVKHSNHHYIIITSSLHVELASDKARVLDTVTKTL